MANREYTRCLIIGSGPAGYTAAIYAGRANLQPIEYCGMQMGGQLTQTTTVENFPGYPQGVDGNQMMMELREQAERFGATLRDGEIVKADLSKAPYLLTTDRGDEIEAETVIIATGATAKYLGLDDEKKYNGQGVSACATCDGFFYRKKVVAVVGGGDTACEEAIYLAQLASKVYMIVRKPYLRASDVMKKRVEENEKIEILYETNTLGLYGENGVKAPISSTARERLTNGSTICPSTDSSSPSGTSPRATCSATLSMWTSRDTSRWTAPHKPRKCPVCLPPAMCVTRAIVRPLSQQARVPRLPSTPRSISTGWASDAT